MLFIAPLVSLALATLVAAQEPPKAVFYAFHGYQGPSYTVYVPSLIGSSFCYNLETIGFPPNSAKLSAGIWCFTYLGDDCGVETGIITSDNDDLPPFQGSVRCELEHKF